jgi:DNA-binding Lrp family transcriptional regulator
MNIREMKGKRRAFLYIDVSTGKEKAFAEKLLRYDEVVEVHLVMGEYDVFAVLEFDLYGQALFASPQEIISKFILDKIRKLREVKDTSTLIPTFSDIREVDNP